MTSIVRSLTLLALVLMLVAQIPNSGTAGGFKSGLKLPLPNGHSFAVQYSASVSDEDANEANAILNRYADC